MPRQVGRKDAAEILLCRSGRRPVVVGQVEMRDADVEGTQDDGAPALGGGISAEVLPQTERDRGQQQPAAPRAPVLEVLVSVLLRAHICSSDGAPASVNVLNSSRFQREDGRVRKL